MPPIQEDSISVANQLLRSKGLKASSCKTIQRLWAGYGSISRLEAVPTTSTPQAFPVSLILKHVTPPTGPKDEGHLRKLISYQVERHFYTVLAPSMPADIAVAQCLASTTESGSTAMILTDLRDEYPVTGEKRGELDETQVYAALDWLAKFHGFWWQRTDALRAKGLRLPPLEEADSPQQDGVWLNGGYTYLATRGTEYASLKNDKSSEWAERLCEPTLHSKRSIAELVADVLSPSRTSSLPSIGGYETLIHGDVKSENLFATSTGSAVAFFDFQYVGLGLGVCDLAKLFTCSVPLELLGEDGSEVREMAAGEKKLLEYYQNVIQEASGKSYPWEVLEKHWQTALVDWLRFQASWGFWGNTDWLEARVRHILDDEEWSAWLLKNANS